MSWKEKWKNLLAKCRTIKNFEIIAAIVIIAVVILIYSSVGNVRIGTAANKQSSESAISGERSELESVLSCIEGAGDVRVLVHTETANGEEVVRGVIVVAEGADDVRVKMELVRAVRKALNVDANAIEIFAMK